MKAKLYTSVSIKDSYLVRQFHKEVDVPLAFVGMAFSQGNWQGNVVGVTYMLDDQITVIYLQGDAYDKGEENYLKIRSDELIASGWTEY